jgi:small GTP-binding protein
VKVVQRSAKESNIKMQRVKCVAVGDGAVGKTCFLITYATKSFPQEYIPCVLDNYATDVEVEGKLVKLELWDTSGKEEYDRQQYSQTDIFLVCFSVVSPSSYENVRALWLRMIRHYCPGVPFLLIGTKADLRDDEATLRFLLEWNKDPVTPAMGHALCANEGAVAYLECSALSQRSLDDVFEAAIRAVIFPPHPSAKTSSSSSHRGCTLM